MWYPLIRAWYVFLKIYSCAVLEHNINLDFLHAPKLYLLFIKIQVNPVGPVSFVLLYIVTHKYLQPGPPPQFLLTLSSQKRFGTCS